jgi:trk system potassium uptake protein
MLGVLHFLSQVLGGLALSMLVPVVIALVDGDRVNAESFLLAAGLTGFVSGAVFFALRGRRWRLKRVSVFVLVLSVWIVPPLIAAVPIMVGAGVGYLPALFEATSGYTTTGASVLTSLESLRPAVIFWRAELQWLGGLMTLISIVAVLAPAGVGGLTSRNVALLGLAGEGGFIRSLATVRVVAGIYALTTAVCFCLLVLVGMPVFDAACIGLATVSTGGFMPIDGDIGSYGRPLAEIFIMFFMLIGATSIVWHRMIMQGRWPMVLAHRESYWVIGIALLVGIVYAVVFSNSGNTTEGSSALSVLIQGLFTGISLVTTTGFEPHAGAFAAIPVAVVAALAIIGAGSMSTAGGMKFFRFGGMFVQSMHELKRLVYPHSVRGTHFGSQAYDIDLMKAIWASAIVALAFVALATLLLTLNHPSFHGGALAAISAFSNIGPLYQGAWDGASNWPEFSQFDPFSMVVVIIVMLVGRVEAIALLGLANLAYWRS